MQSSRKLAIANGELKYFTGRACKNGHTTERYAISGTCIGCDAMWRADPLRRIAARERAANWVNQHPERARASRKAWRHKNVETVRAFRRKWSQKPEGEAYNREYQRMLAKTPKQKAKRAAWQSARHAGKKRAIPKWANKRAICQFYEQCPSGHHVDHVIPLNGRTVSGLHVINNLQYLSAAENMKKRNFLLEQYQ